MAQFKHGDWIYISDFFRSFYQDIHMSPGPHCIVAVISKKDAGLTDSHTVCDRLGVMFRSVVNIYVDGNDFWVPDCDAVLTTSPEMNYAAKERAVYQAESWRQRRDRNLGGS